MMDFLKTLISRKGEPKFEVATRGEGTVKLTARELADRVAADAAKSDYCWIAPATELLWVTGQEGFDREAERRILTHMLNCYAHLLSPTHDIYANDYLIASEILKRLLDFDDVHAKRAMENYFAEFAYRATREPMHWTGIFGEFSGQLAQSHIREWCKKRGKEIAAKYRGSSPDGSDSGEEQFSPGSPLMQQLEKEFSEELKRMSDSGAFDAENAAQQVAYTKLALMTMGRDDRDIDHGENEGD